MALLSSIQVIQIFTVILNIQSLNIMITFVVHSTFCIIAAKDDIRVKSLKARPNWDIVRPAWLLRCLTFNRIVPFRPQDLLVVSRATQDKLVQNFDRFGNSLREATSVEDVGPILQQVKESVCPSFSDTVLNLN